ncbi:MAG: hypothetical protein PVI06_13840 [Desulfobacterales bacterium]|jgi:hypothetical protein
MNEADVYVHNLLKIIVKEDGDIIQIKWTGKSIDRQPDKFISPILVDVLKKSSAAHKRIVFDFCNLNYMNSSTITPIIKILERAKRGKAKITILYDQSLKWQDLNFSALNIFQTKDQRIEIKGLNK